jgi:hypothetical protein
MLIQKLTKTKTMAEEDHNELDEFIGPNLDDMSVLNVLLQTIRGISPVSGSPYDAIPVEDDVES